MSSVVKPKQLKVKTTLDIVPQKTKFVDVIDTGTTTHCFLKESNVEKSEKSTLLMDTWCHKKHGSQQWNV